MRQCKTVLELCVLVLPSQNKDGSCQPNKSTCKLKVKIKQFFFKFVVCLQYFKFSVICADRQD